MNTRVLNQIAFDEFIELGIIETQYEAFVIGVAMGRAEEQYKHTMNEVQE